MFQRASGASLLQPTLNRPMRLATSITAFLLAVPVLAADTARIELSVPGMDREACPITVRKALEKYIRRQIRQGRPPDQIGCRGVRPSRDHPRELDEIHCERWLSFSSQERKLNVAAISIESTLTSPKCGHRSLETMPTDTWQRFYECPACRAVLKPKPGDCCVFCSYGSVKCPPVQIPGDSWCRSRP